MMTPLIGRIKAVLTGHAIPYTRPGSRSAIAKSVRQGVVPVAMLGLDGDEQGDRRIHGGPDKAVNLYAFEHYARWIKELGDMPILDTPGAFGENLSTFGMTEVQICLGDQVRIGGVLLQVSQGRQPCWKLNDRFGLPDMARRLQQNLRTGWYCRVIAPGNLAAEDAIELVARPYPGWPLHRLGELLYHGGADERTLREALALPLVPSWRRTIENRLASGKTEDWTARLAGPAPSAHVSAITPIRV